MKLLFAVSLILNLALLAGCSGTPTETVAIPVETNQVLNRAEIAGDAVQPQDVVDAEDASGIDVKPQTLAQPSAVGSNRLQHVDTGFIGTAMQAPHNAQIPAEILENRFTVLEPTIRTADVLQFCPWSACKISSRFKASTKSGSM